jgi:hypothetical protein
MYLRRLTGGLKNLAGRKNIKSFYYETPIKEFVNSFK